MKNNFIFKIILIINIIFSGCMEDTYTTSSIQNLSSDQNLSDAILSELENNLRSISGNREIRLTNSGRSSLNTSLSDSQIANLIAIVRNAILDSSLESSTQIVDLFPVIIRSAQSNFDIFDFSNNEERINLINGIVWSLIKSSKSRTESSESEESNGKNGVANVLKLITENSVSYFDEAGLGKSIIDNASGRLIETIISSIDETSIELDELDGAVTNINTTTLRSLDNVTGITVVQMDGIIQSVIGKSIASLDTINLSGITLDNVTSLAGSITAAGIESLGLINVSNYTVDNISTFAKSISFAATASLDEISMTGYDSSHLQNMVKNISASTTSSLGLIAVEGYDVFQLGGALEGVIVGATSALDEISADSSSSRGSYKISGYSASKLGDLLNQITSASTGALGDIEMDSLTSDNLSFLSEKITDGAISGIEEISMNGFTSDNVSELMRNITKGVVSAIDEINKAGYGTKKYRKMIRRVTKTATKAIKRLSKNNKFKLSKLQLKKIARNVTKGAISGLKEVNINNDSTEMTTLITQAYSGSRESFSELSDNLTSSELEVEMKAGGDEGVTVVNTGNYNLTVDFDSIDTTNPSISSISPSNNATNISEDSQITITFNENMDESTLDNETFQVLLGGRNVEGKISYESRIAKFSPLEKLVSGRIHQVKVKLNEITDKKGNPAESILGETWFFQTLDSTPPKIDSLIPLDNSTSVNIDSEIKITFSEGINKDSVTFQTKSGECKGVFQISSSNFEDCIGLKALLWNKDSSSVSPIIHGRLNYEKVYKIKINNQTKDLNNNKLVNNFQSNGFTTIIENPSAENSLVTENTYSCDLMNSLSDNNSVIQFNKVFNDWEGDAIKIVQDEDCGYTVSGYKSFSDNSKRAWLAKVDKDGDPVWQKIYNFKILFIGPSAFIKTKDGGYLSSYREGLLKVDKNGKYEWKNTKKHHNKLDPLYNDVVESTDGFYAVTEWHGESGPALVKISKNGKSANVVRRYKSTCKFNVLNALVQSNDDGFIIVGSKVHGNSGYKCSFSWLTNFWILKVNKKGKTQWEKSYGCIPKKKKCSHNWEEATDIAKVTGGYAIVGEKTNYANSPKSLWFMKINESGKILNQYIKSPLPFYADQFISKTSKGGYIWKTRHKSKGDWFFRPSNNYEVKKELYTKDNYFTDMVLTRDGGFILPNYVGLVKTDSELNFPQNIDNVTSTIGEPLEVEEAISIFNDGIVDNQTVSVSSTPNINSDNETVLRDPNDLDNGSLYSEWPSEVIITSDGGYLVVGKSVNEGWPSPKNVDDILVMKFNSDGTSVWNKKYNNKNFDRATSVIEDAGNYIITGFTSSNDSNSSDVLFLKLNSSGNVAIKKTIKITKNYDGGNSIQKTMDGGYIIAGETGHYHNQDYMLLKVDSDGNKKWSKRFKDKEDCSANDVVEVSNGDFYLVGSKRIIYKRENIRIIKLNSSGKKIWDKNYGGDNDDIGEGIVESDNGLVIAASTYSYGEKGDVMLLKIDTNGDVVWKKTYGGNKEDQLRFVDGNTMSGRHLVKTSDGGFLVSGYTKSFAEQPDPQYCVERQGLIKYTLCHENTDMWAFKTNSSGSLLWSYNHPSVHEDQAFSSKESSSGSVVILGMRTPRNENQVGKKTSPFKYGSEDMLLVTIKK